MKVAILAGGLGSRFGAETAYRSKAMIEIGDRPILWHLMQYFGAFGFADLVVALGHHADSIRSYVASSAYARLQPEEGTASCERWWNGERTVELVDTGLETENGGRIRRLRPVLGDQRFMLTWCDGLADLDLDRLLAFHIGHGRLATLTAVHPPGRFGRLGLDGPRVRTFEEKTVAEDDWINGAFFVLEPEVLELIDGDASSFERDTLTRLAADGELMAYRHAGFWQCMDTQKEAKELNQLWRAGSAPWKKWE